VDREKKSSDIDQSGKVKHRIEVTNETSIFNDSFYAPILAKGTLPKEEEIPERLLEAVAILIGRSVEAYVNPQECRAPVALVALALGVDFPSLSQTEDGLHNLATEDGYLHKRSNLLVHEEVQALHSA